MSTPRISIVAAMDDKRGIGKENRIPWHIKEDLINLKNLTLNQVAILGYKTYLSMSGYYDKSGKEMPAKIYIVLTDDKEYKPSRKNATTAYSINDAINKAKEYGTEEIFVIGGSQIFNQMIKLTDRLYITQVKGNFECDTFFPDYSEFKKTVNLRKSSDENFEYEFKVLEK